MNDILSMFRQTLEMEAKTLGTPDKTTINRALELCASAYQLGKKEHDWEALRNQAAISAMQGMLFNITSYGKVSKELDIPIEEVVASSAIAYADALIEQMKK